MSVLPALHDVLLASVAGEAQSGSLHCGKICLQAASVSMLLSCVCVCVCVCVCGNSWARSSFALYDEPLVGLLEHKNEAQK